jgi:PBSX family phage terminase large subunit
MPPTQTQPNPLQALSNLDYPIIFKPLWEPCRYKVMYGGRGAGKSRTIATALPALASIYNKDYTQEQIDYLCDVYEKGTGFKSGTIRLFLSQRPLIVCGRETQKSIADSVHRTIADSIQRLGLSNLYRIQENSIIGKNGAEFIFAGLFRNVQNIKSLEGCTVCYLEEAQNISHETYRILRPTVRAECPDKSLRGTNKWWSSEFWISFNPGYEDDASYELFVKDKPTDAVCINVNWYDNPFFPEVLRMERDEDYRKRPHEAPHIWEGKLLTYGRRVWPEFIPQNYPQGHIRQFKMEDIADKGQAFMAMDPAKHYYPACVWIARIPKPNGKGHYKWVYAEWPTRREVKDDFAEVRTSLLYEGTMLEMSNAIKIKDGLNEFGIVPQARFIDTRYAKGTGAGDFVHGQTSGIVQQFASKQNGGLMFMCPQEGRIDGANKIIKADLTCDRNLDITINNEPDLYIAPWCTNTIQALARHKLEDQTEHESQKYKDFSDALTIIYAGMQGFDFKSQTIVSQKFEDDGNFGRYRDNYRLTGSDVFH